MNKLCDENFLHIIFSLIWNTWPSTSIFYFSSGINIFPTAELVWAQLTRERSSATTRLWLALVSQPQTDLVVGNMFDPLYIPRSLAIWFWLVAMDCCHQPQYKLYFKPQTVLWTIQIMPLYLQIIILDIDWIYMEKVPVFGLGGWVFHI